MNSVNISGNVTRDAEYRQSASGTGILTFGIAVNDRVKNPQSGEWEDKANFVDCVMFGNRANGLNGKITKGMKLAVSGKLNYSTWERDGQKRSKLEVVVNDVDFMQRRDAHQSQQNGSYASQQQQYGNYPQQTQYAPQNGYQQPTGGYQQQYRQTDIYDQDTPF